MKLDFLFRVRRAAISLLLLSIVHIHAGRVLTGVAFGKGIFVAAGYDRTIMESTDAVNWVDKSIVFTAAIPINFTSETYTAYGDSLVLIDPQNVSDKHKLAVPEIKCQYNAVGFGNNRFVILGEGGEIVTSTDGESWHSAISPTFDNLNAVVWGQKEFIAVGDTGTILTSLDGLQWTQRNSGTDKKLSGVAFGNGIFVAVGGDNDNTVILTSNDGITWTPGTMNQGCPITAVAFGNNEFMASAPAGIYCTMVSPDGINWQKVIHPSSTFKSLAYCNDRFVALDSWTEPVSSFNGVDWLPQFQTRKYGLGYNLGSATYGNGTYVAVGEQLAISKDGWAWNMSDVPFSKLLYGYAFSLQSSPPRHYILIRPSTRDSPAASSLAPAGPFTPRVPGNGPMFSEDEITWIAQAKSKISGNVSGTVVTDAHYLKERSGIHSSRDNLEFTVLSSNDGITWTRLEPVSTAPLLTKNLAPASSPGAAVSSVRVGFQLNGQSYELNLSADVGQIYDLQASTDLLHWIDLVTVTNQGTAFNFIDPDAAQFPQRFYRLKIQP